MVSLDSGAEIWDHGLSEMPNDMDSMDSITSDFIETNWKDAAFVKFCFENAIHMSHVPQDAIKRVKENQDDFYKMMHPSDIAHAVMGLVNNEEKMEGNV